MKLKHRDQARFKFICDIVSNLEMNHTLRIKLRDRHKDKKSHRKSFKEWMELEVEIMRACFETSKNPIFIFRGFMVCVDGQLSIPDWIKDYFYKAAKQLLDAAYNKPDGRSEKKILADALDFNSSGRGNFFTQFVNNLDEYSMLAEVMAAKTSSDMSFEEIEGQVL